MKKCVALKSSFSKNAFLIVSIFASCLLADVSRSALRSLEVESIRTAERTSVQSASTTTAPVEITEITLANDNILPEGSIMGKGEKGKTTPAMEYSSQTFDIKNCKRIKISDKQKKNGDSANPNAVAAVSF